MDTSTPIPGYRSDITSISMSWPVDLRRTWGRGNSLGFDVNRHPPVMRLSIVQWADAVRWSGNRDGSDLNPVAVLTQNTKKVIWLYMPNNIQIDSTMDWTSDDMTLLGNFQNFLGMSGGSAALQRAAEAGGFSGGVSSLLSDLKAGLSKAYEKGPGDYLRRTLAGEGIVALTAQTMASIALSGDRTLTRGFGAIANPFKRILFNGVGFRTFEFTVEMRPVDLEGCIVASSIIKNIKAYSLPELVAQNTFLSYPSVFRIHFYSPSGVGIDQVSSINPTAVPPITQDIPRDAGGIDSLEENKYLPRLRPLVCTRVNCNYTPDGVFAAFKNGAPVGISLGLAFSEIEILTKSRVLSDDPDNPGSGLN